MPVQLRKHYKVPPIILFYLNIAASDLTTTGFLFKRPYDADVGCSVQHTCQQFSTVNRGDKSVKASQMCPSVTIRLGMC